MTATLLPPGLLKAELLGGRARAAARPLRHTPTPVPKLPPCEHEPSLLVMIFDDSGSIVGANDAIGNRYEEGKAVMAAYARRCRCRQNLVAIRHFDLGTPGDVGPLALGRRRLPELRSALAPPPMAYGSSELGPSLGEAERLAAKHRDIPVILIAFTDFELSDPEPAQVMARLERWDFGPVHAVVLRAEVPDQLLDTNVVVTRVHWDSPKGAVARAVIAAIGGGRGSGGEA